MLSSYLLPLNHKKSDETAPSDFLWTLKRYQSLHSAPLFIARSQCKKSLQVFNAILKTSFLIHRSAHAVMNQLIRHLQAHTFLYRRRFDFQRLRLDYR